MEKTSESRLFYSGVCLAMLGTFLFALKSIFIKLAFRHGTDATTLLTLRMVLALPFYCGMLYWLRTSETNQVGRETWTRGAQAVGLGFFGYYLASYLDMRGLELISAQLERLTLFTYPAMVSLLAWMFLGETISRYMLLAIALCYAGIWAMYSQERHLLDGDNIIRGMALVLGSALSYSFYVLMAKPTMRHIGSRKFTSLAMIGSTVFMLAHYAIETGLHGFDMSRISPVIVGYGLVLAFVCTVIPSYLLNEAIVRLGASRTTIVGCAGPVVTTALAIVVLREPTSGYHLGGMLMVVLGVGCVAIGR